MYPSQGQKRSGTGINTVVLDAHWVELLTTLIVKIIDVDLV